MYSSAKIFEVGPNFLNLYQTCKKIYTSITYGLRDELNWLSNKKNSDVYSTKADLFSVLTNLMYQLKIYYMKK